MSVQLWLTFVLDLLFIPVGLGMIGVGIVATGIILSSSIKKRFKGF